MASSNAPVDAALDAVTGHAVETTQECLGLSINRITFQATRGDHEAVDFRSRLCLFELCTILVQNGPKFVSREQLLRLWPRIGRAEDPENSTIDGAISELRQELRPLRMKITNRRNIGWRLEEDDEETGR